MVAKEPLERKLRYRDHLASVEGVDFAMFRWAPMLEWTMDSIGFNVLFRFMMDLHFRMDYFFEVIQFDYHPLEFEEYFVPEYEKVVKGIYGKTCYGMSFYDPQVVVAENIERMLWDCRHHTTDHDFPAWKMTSKSITDFIQVRKEHLTARGVDPDYVDGVVDVLALCEGKLMDSAYWDFSCWNINPWKEGTTYKRRSSVDWETVMDVETEFIIEANWDLSRWDYGRWYAPYIRPKRELCDHLNDSVNDFHLRVGMREQYGVKVLGQRVFMYPRTERWLERGGYHQITLQGIIKRVKEELNRAGVIVAHRAGYLAFAQELARLRYFGHRKWKRWKEMITVDELKDKYIRMGLETQLVNRIAEVVG